MHPENLPTSENQCLMLSKCWILKRISVFFSNLKILSCKVLFGHRWYNIPIYTHKRTRMPTPNKKNKKTWRKKKTKKHEEKKKHEFLAIPFLLVNRHAIKIQKPPFNVKFYQCMGRKTAAFQACSCKFYQCLGRKTAAFQACSCKFLQTFQTILLLLLLKIQRPNSTDYSFTHIWLTQHK